MNRSSEKGMVTLLFTSLLLVALLILTLTSYNPLLAQVRISNNQIEKARSFWIAEGGVKCAYSQFKKLSRAPSAVSKCGLPEELEIQVTEVSGKTYQVRSRYQYAEVFAVIVFVDGEYQWLQGSWRDF